MPPVYYDLAIRPDKSAFEDLVKGGFLSLAAASRSPEFPFAIDQSGVLVPAGQ